MTGLCKFKRFLAAAAAAILSCGRVVRSVFNALSIDKVAIDTKLSLGRATFIQSQEVYNLNTDVFIPGMLGAQALLLIRWSL